LSSCAIEQSIGIGSKQAPLFDIACGFTCAFIMLGLFIFERICSASNQASFGGRI